VEHDEKKNISWICRREMRKKIIWNISMKSKKSASEK